MNRLAILLCGFISATSLQGCTPPALLSGDEQGGVLSHANARNEAAAFAVADAYCHKNGRGAQVTGIDADHNKLTFSCVKP